MKSDDTSGNITDWELTEENEKELERLVETATNNVMKNHSETFWKLRASELEDKLNILQAENDQLKHNALGFDSEGDYKERIKQLEVFIESSLGLKKPVTTSPCADPISYCNSCGCGKKEAALAKEKGK